MAESLRFEQSHAGFQELVEELRARLEAERHRLDEEIRAYPTPIPRCDAQFNHLFEQRTRIVAAIEALGALDATDI